jgi:hypothetical protein
MYISEECTASECFRVLPQIVKLYVVHNIGIVIHHVQKLFERYFILFGLLLSARNYCHSLCFSSTPAHCHIIL